MSNMPPPRLLVCRGLVDRRCALLLAIAIGGMMAWQWCHTSDWQDRYW
jgi:hypothetical protein